MLGSGLLVFREVLEAALIVSIVAAATRGVAGRGRWIGAGIGAGVLGAIIVACFAGVIAQAVSGIGQELFNASVLLAAVLMIAWHATMAGHPDRDGNEIGRRASDRRQSTIVGAADRGRDRDPARRFGSGLVPVWPGGRRFERA